MKNIILFLVIIFFIGCADKIRSYVEEPQSLLRDPHFAQYEEERQALEHAYLEGQITYVDYLQRKKELDEKYEKEVQDREAAISGE